MTLAVNGQAPNDYGYTADTTPGTYPLNSEGYTEDQFIVLPGGTDSISATYGGDNNYTPSNSQTATVNVTLLPTTMDIGVQPSSTLASGQTITVQSYVYGTSKTFPLTGTATYYLGNTPLQGTTTYFPESSAQGSALLSVTFSGPVTGLGTYTLFGQYNGDAHNAAAKTPQQQITLNDFSATANPTNITIPSPGQSGRTTITINPLNGFSDQVYVLAPTGCPTGASCTLTNAGYYVNVPTSITLTVATTAPVSSARPGPLHRLSPPGRPLGRWPWLLVELLMLVMLMRLAARLRRPAGLLAAGALLLVGIWVACGGGGGGGGSTPPPATQVTLSSSSLSFSPQNVGTTSAAQAVTLTNSGTATLDISSMNMGGTNSGDFSETNSCGSAVSAGANCTVSVKFTPAAAGNRAATLSINDNASGSPQTVSFSGVGAAPPSTATLSPNVLSFGQVYLYSTSAAQTLALTNSGATALSIAEIIVVGANPGDFSQTNNCGATVAAGANCTFNVSFLPQAAGNRSAILNVYDSAAGSPQTAFFSGAGLAQTTTAIINPPWGLSFGQINVGTTSIALQESVSNTGTGTLTITGIAFSGDNPNQFAETDNCGTPVSPGASCTINVTFKPSATGNFDATLTVNSSASALGATVSGTGVQPSSVVVLSPLNLVFGLENEYVTSPPQTVTLTNKGTTALQSFSISAGNADFGETNNCGLTVAAGASCTINVTFTPVAVGTRLGDIQVSDSAPNNPQVVSLSGTAVPPATPPGTYNLTVKIVLAGDEDVHTLTIPVTLQ